MSHLQNLDESDSDGCLHAAAAYILRTNHHCYHCGHLSPVFAVMPVGPYEMTGDVGCKPEADGAAAMSTPVYLPEAIAQHINETSEGRFFSDDSYSTGES